MIKHVEYGTILNLIDPLRIAEDIITMRSNVLAYIMIVKLIMEQAITSDHMNIRRTILSIQMNNTISYDNSTSENIIRSPSTTTTTSTTATTTTTTTASPIENSTSIGTKSSTTESMVEDLDFFNKIIIVIVSFL
jgi:hypothetical protein